MRITSGSALLLSAFSAYFLTTDSYVSPARLHRYVASRPTNLNELVGINSNNFILKGFSACDRRFQLQCNGGDSPWSDQLLSKIRKPFVGLLAAVSILVLGARNAVARPPKSSKAIGSAQKTTVLQNKKDRQVSSKQPKKAVVVELVVKKNSISSSQLSRVGFVLVGVSTVATLLTGDDTKKKTKVVKKQVFKAPSRPTVTFDDEDEVKEPIQRVNRKISIAPGVEKPTTSPEKVRTGLSSMTSLPPQEDLFSEGDADDFFEVTSEDLDAIKDEVPLTSISSKKQNKFSLPPSASKMDKVPDIIEDDESFAVPEVRVTPVASTPTPPPPPAKKGIFDRIFQKRSTSRPTDIAEVLRVQDTASSFRVAIATILTAYLPQGSGTFPDVEIGGVFSYPIDEEILFESEEKRISILASLKDDLELQSKEAAEAFADVTNAMLVTLTDNCVDLLDRNGKIAEDAEASIGVALDTLTDFAISAAGLFGQLLPGIIIEDGGIKYNGKAQRGKLETLFSCLMKGGMDLKALTNMMKDDGEPDPNSEVDMEKRSGRIQCLQHIFSISEGKRGSLEQKAMKDMIMSMVGSEGAGSDFAGMLGNMGGLGGMGGGGPGASPEDAEKFNQMLKEEMKKTTGQDDDFDMAEMSAMLSESLGAMRQAVKDGTVTKKEVAELEVSLGCSLKEVITMTEAAVKMSRGSPELESMVSLFKQLQVIKNK